MDGGTHTAIILHTCGSCNTVTCYTVESISEYILEQSVSVRAVPELIVREAGRQSNVLAKSHPPFCIPVVR